MKEDTILKEAFTVLKDHPFVDYNCIDDLQLRSSLLNKMKEIKEEEGNIKALKHCFLREWRQAALKDYRYRKHVLMQGHEIVSQLLDDIEKFENSLKDGEW